MQKKTKLCILEEDDIKDIEVNGEILERVNDFIYRYFLLLGGRCSPARSVSDSSSEGSPVLRTAPGISDG